MANTARLSSRDPEETKAIEQTARLKVINPDEKMIEAANEPEPEIQVEIEGDSPVQEEVKEERKAVEAHEQVPKVEPQVDVKTDEGVETLRKQIEELKAHRASENQRLQQALAAAERIAQENEQNKAVAFNSQYDMIVNTLSAAQLESETAKQQYAMAASNNDYHAMAEAQSRMTKAETTIAKMEDGKRAFEDERNRPQPVQQQPQQQGQNLLPQEQAWLDRHPEVMKNGVLNERLNAAYYIAVNRGFERGTTEYFNFIEQELGYREKPQQVTSRAAEPASGVNPALVSAPVSRESQSMSTGEPTTRKTFRLTKEQAEIAKVSGLTPQEYAKQLIKLEEMKKSDPERYYGRS